MKLVSRETIDKDTDKIKRKKTSVSTGNLVPNHKAGTKQESLKDIRDKAIKKIWGEGNIKQQRQEGISLMVEEIEKRKEGK